MTDSEVNSACVLAFSFVFGRLLLPLMWPFVSPGTTDSQTVKTDLAGWLDRVGGGHVAPGVTANRLFFPQFFYHSYMLVLYSLFFF